MIISSMRRIIITMAIMLIMSMARVTMPMMPMIMLMSALGN